VINLVAPVPLNPYTGGHLVNDRLAEDSRVRVLHASSLADATNFLARTTEAIVIVDSLFLPDTVGLHAIRECAGEPVGLMAHSLPSLVPGPTPVDRRRMLDAERASLALFDFAIAPSEFMVRALVRRGLPPERTSQVTPAPIVDGRDARRTHGTTDSQTDGPVQILTIANWSPSKGIDTVWTALQKHSGLEWHWTIIGAWNSSAFGRRLHGEISASPMANRVDIRPTVRPETLHDAYHSADLFVLPSLMESYGLVFAEAITHGLPILAAAAAAVPEVLGGAAILTVAGDEAGLARELRRLITDRKKRERLSQLAREHATDYPDWQQVRRQFVAAVELARTP